MGIGGIILLDGNHKRLGENLFQCHFVHQTFHREWMWIEPGPSQCESEVIFILYLDGRIYFIDFYSSYNKTSNYCCYYHYYHYHYHYHHYYCHYYYHYYYCHYYYHYYYYCYYHHHYHY